MRPRHISLQTWGLPAVLAACVLAACVLSACTVGPRYRRPAAGVPAAFKESSAAAYQGADAGTWRPASPADAALKGAWWHIFNEPELDSLEQQLDINNQTIAQYFQNFMAARAQVAEARAGLFPTVSVDPAVTRSHEAAGVSSFVGTSGASGTTSTTTTGAASSKGGSTFTVFSLPADVSWAPDLWGRIRNTVGEYRYAAQVSAADLQNERLTEEASLAEYYFELRGEDALQDIYNRTVAADQQSLDLTRGLFQTGIDDAEAVAQAQVTLANAQANAVGVAAARAQYEHAIAMLIGKPASDFSLPVKDLSTKVPPIPLGIPSALLQRRPDIAAAERTMAEANAEIGIATAAYYPSLTLSGSAGFESTTLSSLFSAPSFLWSLGASASETLFEGGLRHATVAQYRATYNADVASYRQTVLTAFQQVEDGIAALRIYSHQLERQQAAVNAAQQYLDIAMVRYQTGIDPYINVMTAQTTLLSDQLTQISEEVTELTQAVELVQALGGGWSVSQLPSG
jgi:NodT family efflux transporter outer membrane factor (OMF) lipoprotein